MLAVEDQLPSRARGMRWCTQRPSIPSAGVGFQVTVTNALLPRASAASAEITPAPVPTSALRGNVRFGVLKPAARLPVDHEPVEDSGLHHVHPVHEPARGLEVRAHADELGMVPVRAPGAVVEGYVPQLARPHARAVAGPRAHDLRVGEPDLAPDD